MATAIRYALSDITGVRDTYSSNPGADGFASLGQVVFALDQCRSTTLIGQCTCGCNLVPWGICCYFNPYVNSACIGAGCCCCACSFCLGGSSTIYVALGSMGGCGATLWRRIQ
jgi:hypothetical protein